MSPQLQTLDGQPMSWEEAHRRVAAWYARHPQQVATPPRAAVTPVVAAPVPRLSRTRVRMAEAVRLIETLERVARVPQGTICSRRRDVVAVELRDAIVLVLRMRGWIIKDIGQAVKLTEGGVVSALARAGRRQDREFREMVEALMEREAVA